MVLVRNGPVARAAVEEWWRVPRRPGFEHFLRDYSHPTQGSWAAAMDPAHDPADPGC